MDHKHTSGPHLHLFNLSIHIVHILIGAGIAVLVLVPIFWWRTRRAQKAGAAQGEAQAAAGKHEARSERIKSDIILSGIEDGVIVVGADHIIQLFNPGAARISGWPTKEAENLEYRSVFKLMDAKGKPYELDQDPFEQVFKHATAVRDAQAFLLTKSKRQIPVEVNVSPIMANPTTVSAAVGVFRDVTQERQAEQQRAEFISTASHEMRTPVAAIEGYLALALNAKVANIDNKARSYLEKAHASTQHLGKLFQDLLTSAKAEDGRISSHPQVVEIGNLLEQVTDTLRFTAQNKGLKTEFIVGTNSIDTQSHTIAGSKVVQPLYYAYVDPDRLREAITNLFDNAVKYTETGKITIGLTGDDKVVQFYVQDSGSGIPNEDIPHLFQKFYRVDNTATRTIGGTGLGLFICRKIVELYDGRIWVESELGKGTTFYINLPRLDTKKAAELQSSANQAGLPPITPLSQL